MAINHVKRCSTSLSIKETHIKATTKYHYTTIGNAKTKTKANEKNLIIPSADEGVEQLELSFIAHNNAKWFSTTLENSLAFSCKVKHTLTYYPLNQHLGT